MSEQRNSKLWRISWVVILFSLLVVVGGALLVANRFRTGPSVAYQRGIIHLRSGAPDKALESLSDALRMKPDFKEAQIAVFRAHLALREFDLAEEAVDNAVGMGLGDFDAGLYRAEISSIRADHRFRTEYRVEDEDAPPADGRDPVSDHAQLCRHIIDQDLEPALANLKALLEKPDLDSEGVARASTAVGDLQMQKSRIVASLWQRLREATEDARLVGKKEDVQQRDAGLSQTLTAMREAQDEAIAAYTRAHEAHPEMVQPRLAKARHFLSSYVPNPAQAREVLEPVIEGDPKHREARKLLAAAERVAGNIDTALEHARAMRQDPDDFDALMAETAILVHAERWEEALPATEKLVELRPSNEMAAFFRGRALLHEDRAEEALPHLQKATARIRGSWASGRYYLAEGLMKTGRRHQAITEYQKAIEDTASAPPTDILRLGTIRETRYDALVALSEAFKEEDPTLSARRAKEALEVFPFRPDAYERAKAAALASEATPREVEDVMLIHAAGLLAARDGNGTAAHCLREFEAAENPDDVWRVGILRARILARQGNYTEAVEAYERLRGVRPDKRPLYELAELRARLEHYKEAREVYQELLDDDAEDERAVRGMVAVLGKTGDVKAMRKVLLNAAQTVGAEAPRQALVALYMRQGMADEAVRFASTVVVAEPRNPAAHVLLAETLWRAGRLEDARAAYDRALGIDPEFASAYRRGILDLQMGKAEEAVQLYERSIEALPNALAPKVNLALAAQAAGAAPRAVETLRRALAERDENQGGMADLLRWYIAVAQAGMGEVEAALELNATVGTDTLGPKDERVGLLRKLASLPKADREKATLALNLMVGFSRASAPDATLEQADALVKMLPGEALPVVWRAGALDAMGRGDEAVALLERLVSDQPGLLFARIRLAETHARRGGTASAVGVLKETLEHASDAQAPGIHFLVGQFQEQAGELDEAAEHYEAAMKGNVAPLARNNLAYMIVTQGGDLERALEIAEQAVEDSGPRPEIMDTLGWVHHHLGDSEKAIRCLEIARRGLPQVAMVRFHLGMAYLKAGRLEEARKELAESLAITRDFPQAHEAEAALDSLL